jgi:hypothetical protein
VNLSLKASSQYFWLVELLKVAAGSAEWLTFLKMNTEGQRLREPECLGTDGTVSERCFRAVANAYLVTHAMVEGIVEATSDLPQSRGQTHILMKTVHRIKWISMTNEKQN